MPHTVHSLIMRICPVGQSIHLILFSPLFNDHLVTMEMVIQVHPNCSNYVFTTRGRSRGGALVPALVSGQTKLDGLRKVISEVWPHYYLKVWKSEPPHLLEDLNLPLTTAIKNKGFTQCLLIIFLFWTFTICFIDLFHFHSLRYHITSLPLPIIATFQQRPLTSVSRVAIIERFDCVRGSVTGSPNLHKEEGCTRFLFLQALSESNWPLMRHCFTQKSCFTSCA